MKTILSGIILSLFICSPALAKPKPSNLPYCDFAEEDPSSIERTVTLTEVGISIKIPVNTRVVKKTDGSIELMDNGTYQLFQCMSKPNSGVAGRGYLSTIIEKVTPEYFYDYVIKQVPNKEGMYIASKKSNLDGNYGFELWLRIRTPKGVFDIKDNNTSGYLTTKEEIEQELKDIVMSAFLITIIN